MPQRKTKLNSRKIVLIRYKKTLCALCGLHVQIFTGLGIASRNCSKRLLC